MQNKATLNSSFKLCFMLSWLYWNNCHNLNLYLSFRLNIQRMQRRVNMITIYQLMLHNLLKQKKLLITSVM